MAVPATNSDSLRKTAFCRPIVLGYLAPLRTVYLEKDEMDDFRKLFFAKEFAMTTMTRNRNRRPQPIHPAGNCTGAIKTRQATKEQRGRARKLLATEIAFISNPSFLSTDMTDGKLPTFSGSQPLPAAKNERKLRPGGMRSNLLRFAESPILTIDQERELFRRMNCLKYQANVVRATIDPNNLDLDALKKAERLLREARAVRDQIVHANTRLVMAVVKKYVTRRNSFDELLSDGLLMLLKAVEKFDYSRGFRFSTYAYLIIGRSVYRSLAARRNLNRKLVQFADGPLEIVDDSEPSTLIKRSWKLLEVSVGELLGQLSVRERFVVGERFGLGSSSKSRTLKSLAEELGVSKERVRQIELRAVAKLNKLATEMRLETLLESDSP